jgi:hypothetical protein
MNYSDLPEVPDNPGYRYVNGTPMTEEQWQGEGWIVTGSYTTDSGKQVHYFAVDPEGIKRYAQVRAQRKAARYEGWAERDRAFGEWMSELEEGKR